MSTEVTELSQPRSTTRKVLAAVALAAAGLLATSGATGAHDALPSPDVSAFGDAPVLGSTSSVDLVAPVVSMAATSNGHGYWEVAADGGIFSFGDAQFMGSMGGTRLNEPVVGMAATPDGRGYWEVAADGGIFSFGDAQFMGSMGGTRLNEPVVGMAATPDGRGYWEVAADGGIFSFGDAQFMGSMGGTRLNEPVVDMAATPDGRGYWEVAADGGIFSFGDAPFLGSMGGQALAQPVTGIAAFPGGHGYWEVAADGGTFAFGSSRYFGSYGAGLPSVGPMYMRFVGMASSSDGGGYWLVASGFCSSPGSTGPLNFTSPQSSTQASLAEISAYPLFSCLDQVQFRFAVPAPAATGYDVRYVAAPTASPSGLPVRMAGNAFLQITLTPANANDYTGPTDIVPTGTKNIEDIRLTQNFEGVMTWDVGLAHTAPVWVGQPPPGGSQFLVVNIG